MVDRVSGREPSKAPALLLLTELFPPAIGGSAVLFQGIYSRVEGADVVLLTDGGPGCAGPAAESGAGLRIVRHALATSRRGVLDPRGLWHHLGVAAHVRRLLPRRDGLVHCARAIPEGIGAMLARAFGGPRYVCWTHGEDLAGALTSRELTWLTRWVYRWADAALANSRNTATLLKSFGVPDAKIHIVYPAVDARRFHPLVEGSLVRRRFADDDDVLLLSVGRLQRRKGHDVAIQAVARLRERLPNLRYVIAGDGEERQRLEQMVAELGVRDRVFFAGIVGDAELPSYYAACDVFLLPNRVDHGDIEGFGIVFLEAAAAGRPVIGGNSGGVPEAVEGNVTGLLVDGASVDSVAAAIADLAQSARRRHMMGAAGRVRAVERFSWERAAAAVSDLHRHLMADGGAP